MMLKIPGKKLLAINSPMHKLYNYWSIHSSMLW